MSGNSSQAAQRHPIYRLPLDLILMITDRLTPEDFIHLAFANYPLLRHYGLVPAMSRIRIAQLVNQSQLPSMFRLLPMPTELLLHTMRMLSPIDLMRFVLANYDDLVAQGIAPALTRETIQALTSACQQG